MKRAITTTGMSRSICRSNALTSRRGRRAGNTLIETIVACGLLMTILSITTSSIVRNRRLQTEQRHYRVALDEITNALDRFTQLPPNELPEALAAWHPSAFAAQALPTLQLHSSYTREPLGTRIVVAIDWDQVGRRESPLTLVGWGPPEESLPTPPGDKP